MEYHLEQGNVLPRFELNDRIHYVAGGNNIVCEVIALNDPITEEGEYTVDLKIVETGEIINGIGYDNLRFIH